MLFAAPWVAALASEGSEVRIPDGLHAVLFRLCGGLKSELGFVEGMAALGAVCA